MNWPIVMEFCINEQWAEPCSKAKLRITIVYFSTRGKNEAFRHELNLESRAEVGQWASLANYLICYHTRCSDGHFNWCYPYQKSECSTHLILQLSCFDRRFSIVYTACLRSPQKYLNTLWSVRFKLREIGVFTNKVFSSTLRCKKGHFYWSQKRVL